MADGSRAQAREITLALIRSGRVRHEAFTAVDRAISDLLMAAASEPTLCTFGPPAERQRRWILMFEDRDRGDMYFDGESEAMMAWDRCKDAWTCTLFATAEFVQPR